MIYAKRRNVMIKDQKDFANFVVNNNAARIQSTFRKSESLI